MQRKKSSNPSRVYVYGLPFGPTDGADVVREQLMLAHRYYNANVEIEKERRAEWVKKNEAWGLINAQISPIAEKIEEIKTVRNKRKSALGYQKKLIKEGKRAYKLTQDEKKSAQFSEEEKSALTYLNSEKKRLNKEKKGKKPATDDLKEIRRAYWKAASLARGRSGVYPGTYELIDKAFESVRETPQSDLKFRSYTGEGSLAVRFTGGGEGGICLKDIFGGEDTRIRIQVLDPVGTSKRAISRRRALVHMRVASTDKRKPVWATFPMVYHRELPADASVKTIKMVAYRVGTEMKYELHFSIEAESMIMPRKTTGKSVGFDLGWRGGERFGCFADVESSTAELKVLPSDIKGRQSRSKSDHADHIKSIADKAFDEIIKVLIEKLPILEHMPPELRKGFDDIAKWKSHQHLHTIVFGRPVFTHQKHVSPGVLRVDGKWGVGRFWNWRENRFEGDAEVYEALEKWAHQDRHLYQWWSNEKDRFVARRSDHYRNLAKEKCLEYDTIYVENLQGDNMAKSKVAGGNRVITAPFEFLRTLKTQAKKYGCEVVEVSAQETSMIHYECGTVNERSADETLTCDCGQSYDRDENAAKNIHRRGLNLKEQIKKAA